MRFPRPVVDLPRLVTLIAQRTSEELVPASLARALGLSHHTVTDYLGLLETFVANELLRQTTW